MKRFTKILTSLLCVAALSLPLGVGATNGNANGQNKQKEKPTEISLTTPLNTSFGGKVNEVVENKENGYFTLRLVKDEPTVTLIANKDLTVYSIPQKKVIKVEDIKKDDYVTAITGINVPMTVSLPPQISDIKMLVVSDSEESVAHSVFTKMDNGSYINSTATLVAHMDSDTKIIDQKGSALSLDQIGDKELAMFYTITTRSIPPQTSPNLVVALDKVEVEKPEKPEKPESKMLPLRGNAERRGIKVEWVGDAKQTIILSKGAVSFTLNIGETKFGYNKMLSQMTISPELRGNATFVPSDFFDFVDSKLAK